MYNTDSNDNNNNTDDGVGNSSLDFSSCSVEALLSVPNDFIFRDTRTGPQMNRGDRGSPAINKQKLFSRSEAQTALQVAMLASELDIVLSLVYEALDRSQKCKVYRQYIERGNLDSNAAPSTSLVYLRALLPLLDVHVKTAEKALTHVTSETVGIGRILNDLEKCAMELRKFAEQNWNMADQFDWAMLPGQTNLLSAEKRAIAEIEEQVAERILTLRGMAFVSGGRENGGEIAESDAFEKTDEGKDRFTSMNEFCIKVFAKSSLSETSQQERLTYKKTKHNTPTKQSDGEENDFASQISVSRQSAAEALRFLGGK